jgi:transcriptional regulator with XRE-family HTH domain
MGGVAVFVSSSIGRKLLAKLQRPLYRHAYLAEHVRRGIAYQIRALRDQRGWNQGKFSGLLGKPQSVVCRLEDPSYGKFTVQTLLEIANVYDVALEVRFVSYSLFLQHTRDVSAISMYVPEFRDDSGMSAAVLISQIQDRPAYLTGGTLGNIPSRNRPIQQHALSGYGQDSVTIDAVQRRLSNFNDVAGNVPMITNALSSAIRQGM